MIGFLGHFLLWVLPYAVVLGVVVTIHELGHFLAAKSVGTAIERFSIGFGPAIARWTDRAGVEWRVSCIPLGGYVKFAGDENVASVPDADDLSALRAEVVAQEGEAATRRYFHFKPLWQRAYITAAGPVSNFILAIAVFAGLLMALGQPLLTPRVDIVHPGSPAERAGFKTGDQVVSVDGQSITDFDQIKMRVLLSSDTPLNFIVDRAGRRVALVAVPQRGVIIDQLGHAQRLGQLGIEHRMKPGDVTIKRYGFGTAVVEGARMSWDRVDTTVHYIGRMLSGREKADQLAGPVGMAQMSGALAEQTAKASHDAGTFVVSLSITMLELIAAISVGVGFLNLLPVPVLDGGHLLFYAYEAVARRPLAAKVQAAGYRVGLALVLGLMLFATWNDLQRLRVFNLFGGLFS
jgi:regulator of sigma E protease